MPFSLLTNSKNLFRVKNGQSRNNNSAAQKSKKNKNYLLQVSFFNSRFSSDAIKKKILMWNKNRSVTFTKSRDNSPVVSLEGIFAAIRMNPNLIKSWFTTNNSTV